MELKDFDTDDLKGELWRRGIYTHLAEGREIIIAHDREDFRSIVQAALDHFSYHSYPLDDSARLIAENYIKILDA